MPARYVIGQDGVIAYAEVNADYTRRPDPEALFPVLDQLRRKRSTGSTPSAPRSPAPLWTSNRSPAERAD